MKFDLNNKTNRFAQRTLAAFSSTLLALLTKKAFEEITVNELCQRSNYPRATFYNYFEDIYDLLNYCWWVLGQEIELEDYVEMPPEERAQLLFDRLYTFLESNQGELEGILKHNKVDGKLLASFQKYMKEQTRRIMSSCPYIADYAIPYELVAEHYSNTLLLVMEWSFLRKEKYSREQAQTCIKYLIGDTCKTIIKGEKR